MLSRIASSVRSRGGQRLIQQAQQSQRRQMGGGGAFMETNKFGENVGEVFGTIAWLWVFYRFHQDGAVLLGLQHPWEHGHDSHGASNVQADLKETWESYSVKSIIPGDDDDDDEDDDDDDEDED